MDEIPIGRCLALCEDGATMVAATPRLARHLREHYARRQRDKGAGAWAGPDVLTWEAWLARVFRESGGDRPAVVLNDAQELALWEQVIRDDLARAGSDDVALWQHGPAARAARHARAVFHHYLMQDMSRDAIGDDARAFLRWQRDFDSRLDARGHLDNAVVGTRLLAHLETLRARPPALPSTVILAGFAAPAPLRERVCATLTGLGVTMVSMIPPDAGGTAVRCRAGDPEDELCRAASWCRQKLLAAGAEAGDDPPRLGVVISGLGDERRDLAARVFEQALGGYDPTLDSVGAARLFHLSLGAPLARHPMVAAALEWLEWLSGDTDYETFSRAARSPFIAGADEEWAARGRLDAELRRVLPARVTPALLRSALRAPRLARFVPPGLGARLRAALAAAKASRRRSPAAWSATFGEWLAAAGWPGERARNSHEHQALRAWADVMAQCASLTLVERPCHARRAWVMLMRMASDRVFNPEAVPAPVQLLGVDEAAGLEFDALWVTGMTDEAWPPPVQPLPFLPVAEQRRLNMPRASWDASLRDARDTIARLKAAAPDVVFSYPEQEDERTAQVSALIRDVRDVSDDDATYTVVRHPGHLGAARRALETVRDVNGPALAGAARVRGGAGLFRDQAACPFRAFARHRLGSESIEPARHAINAMDHGVMVHAALERLWEAWRTQDALKADVPERAVEKAGAAIDATLDRYQRDHPGVMSAAARALQRDRMLALLCAHLDYEAARPPFTVAVHERVLEREFHGLRVRGRIDRVDELADGAHLLIDYKTGRATPAAWFGDAPDEPQVPLYRALLGDDRVAGVAFAMVRRDVTRDTYLAGLCDGNVPLFSGLKRVSASEMARKQAVADWPALVARWDEVCARLARAIVAGDAAVAPQAGACDVCDQRMVCRIDEHRALSGDDGDGAAGGAERRDA